MNVSANMREDYERIPNPTLGENKPNSNPISTETKINLTLFPTKDYEDTPPRGSKSNFKIGKMNAAFFTTNLYDNKQTWLANECFTKEIPQWIRYC
jgi:hypothetical protein